MDWRTRTSRDFDRLAPSWDGRHGPTSIRRVALRMRSAYLRDLCASHGRPRLLDIGCGTGQQLLALAAHLREGVGVDLSPAMIGQARHNAAARGLGDRLRFHALAAEEVSPGRLGSFEVVLFYASLEHMADARHALARAAAVLEPGGMVVLVLVHPWHPRGLYARVASRRGRMPALRQLTPGTLRRCTAEAGLRPLGPFGPECLRATERARRLRHRLLQHAVAFPAFGSYLAVFS